MQQDRTSLYGFILMFLLLGAWWYFAKPDPKDVKPLPKQAQTNQEAQKQKDSLAQLPDTVRQQLLTSQYGDFAALAQGEDKTFNIKTDLLTLNIGTKGGVLRSAYINGHKTFDGKPLPVVVDEAGNELYEEFVWNNQSIKTKDLYFTPQGNLPTAVTGKDSAKIVLRAALNDKQYLEKIYTLHGDKYDVHYNFALAGMKEGLKNDYYEIHWRSELPVTEKALDLMRPKSTTAYSLTDDMDKLSATDEMTEKNLEKKVNWVSFKSQFFSEIVIADQPFKSAKLVQYIPKTDSVNKVMQATLVADFTKSDKIEKGFTLYMGPNEYLTLKNYGSDLHKQLDLGWSFIHYINIGATYVFKWLEKGIHNYGLIILIFAILVKLITLPMTYKSFVSMARMRVVNETPEIKELDEKFKDDAQGLQVEKMKIYNSMGVSMFGGCVPMLLQYPILISMLSFFPQLVEMRQKPFLWADDLSSFDSIASLPFSIPMYGDHVSLFTILMCISTLVFTWYQQKNQPQQAGAMAQQMKVMSYIMPVFLLFFLNRYPAGLSFYYLCSNILAILQSQVIKGMQDDKKILEELHAIKTKKASQPKSKMQEWMDKQQEMQRQMQGDKEQTGNRRTRRQLDGDKE